MKILSILILLIAFQTNADYTSKGCKSDQIAKTLTELSSVLESDCKKMIEENTLSLTFKKIIISNESLLVLFQKQNKKPEIYKVKISKDNPPNCTTYFNQCRKSCSNKIKVFQCNSIEYQTCDC